MKRFLAASGLLVALFLIPGEAQAQTGGVKGRVVDDKGQPMADVPVLIEFQGATLKFQLKTDAKGQYLQIGLKVGMYKVTASKDGYQSYVAEEKIGMGEPTSIDDLVLKKATGGGGGKELAADFTNAANLLKANDLDGAEAAFNAILAKHPGLPEGHYDMGIVHSRRKDFEGAAVEFRKAVDIKPEYTEAWIGLAKAYQDGGDKDKALEAMKEAGSQNADDPKVQFSLGVFFLNSQQLDEAETAFKKAQTLDASNSEVLYYLGTITLNKGDTAGAVALLQKYVASSPKNTQNLATAQGLIAALKTK